MSPSDPTPTEPSAPADPLAHFVAGPARDVQLIAQKAVLGFVADGSAYRAGYDTHAVSVLDGVAEVTPYHYAGGERVTGGKVGLETGAIVREDGAVISGAGGTRLNRDGAVEIGRGQATEVVKNREDGIQQEWQFAQAPDGEGDLTVEVAVTGQRFVGKTGTGLHFKSDAGLGFRYSNALWLDAAGHEWPIDVAWKDERIQITVPEDVLAQSTFPAVLDPTITAEVVVDAPVNGATGVNSATPAVAFDGTNYLVVWADQRLSRDEDIFATRVSQAGAILDTTGITVNAGAGRQLHPQVVFAGTQYLVVWEDFKITNGPEADISAARVSTAGVVTQLGRVAPSAQNEISPKIAANGNSALLVWENAGNIRASLFNGTSFGGAISVTADAVAQSEPAVAANPGGNYLVAYTEGAAGTADLKGQFVSQAGVKQAGVLTLSAGAGRQSGASAAWDGVHYLVTFTNNSAGINLFGERISTAGAVLDTHTEGAVANVGGVSISSAAGNQELSSVSCGTGGCLVTWQESRNAATTGNDVFAQRLNTAGATLANTGAEIIVSAANRGQFVPAVTAAGADFFAVWQDNRDTDTNTVFGTTIRGTGAVVSADGLMLVRGNNREVAPAVGRSGTTFGVFWTDSRNFGSDISLVRFAGASKPDNSARVVSNATFAQSSPAVTSSSGNFFAVWQDSRNGKDRDIFGARVTAAGSVLDPAGLAITTAAGDQLVPEIAANGTVALVVWQDRRNGNFDIFGAVVDIATGAVTAADIPICTVAGDQGRPSVAFDSASGQFFVVWSDERIAADANLFGARVSTAGAVLDTNGVSLIVADNGQFSPRATFLNGTALVVWEDRRLDTQGDIFGARVRITGGVTVLDAGGFSISGTAAGTQTSPAVSSLSGSFLVAWTDGRNVNTTGTDIFGQQIGATGTLNGAAFEISANPENEDDPQLSDAPTNVTRIAYTRVRPDLQTVRVQSRTIGASSGSGQACSQDAQCSTGFCVDSRCCDTACGGNNKTDCQACVGRATGGVDGTCGFVLAGTTCRGYASTFCDLREFCTGADAECPPDVGRREGLVCNAATGAVCPSNAAPGPHGCP